MDYAIYGDRTHTVLRMTLTIEVWFSILSAKALRGASFRSVKQLIAQIDAFIAAYNEDAAPFEWTKVNVSQKTPASKYANLTK